MVDRVYSDERLASVYDTLNPPDISDTFYLDLAGALPHPATILDVGCGTGRLACALAKLGHNVTGADPAMGMLGIARRRPGGENISWVNREAAQLDLNTRFDLIIMTGHVFQVFTSEQDILAVLTKLRRHLAPNGRLAFESRNPLCREWEEWVPELSTEQLSVPGIGGVEVFNSIAVVDLPLVTFQTHFTFATEDCIVEPTTLRFTPFEALEQLLAEAGFNKVKWHGGWDRRPWTPDCHEIIVIASESAENA